MKRPDEFTVDLFDLPHESPALPGALDFDLAVRHLIAEAIKHSALNATLIAARMSELLGFELSAHQLHSWTAPSRDAWRFPLAYLPALEVACETVAITTWLASVRGGRLRIGREALDSELGKQERLISEAQRKVRALKKLMGEGE